MIDKTVHAPASRANLTEALETAAAHLRPVIQAVRDDRIGMLFIGQSADPFRLPRDPQRSAIIIIGDDMHRAVGPEGFHLPSVRRIIRACSAFAVVSSAAPPDVYEAMASTAAVTRCNTLLIETRPECEIQWLSLIQKLVPRRPVILATVKGGHA